MYINEQRRQRRHSKWRLHSVVAVFLVVLLLLFSTFLVTAQHDEVNVKTSQDENGSTTSTTMKPIVLIASSTSKQVELIQFIHNRQIHLRDVPIIVQPDTRTAIQLHPTINFNELNIVGTTRDYISPELQHQLRGTPSSSSTGIVVDEIIVANMVLQDQIKGVVYLRDIISSSESSSSSLVVENACNIAGLPFAVNVPSAEWILRAVVRQHRKAFLLFNPVAGHGDPQDDLRVIRQTLELQLDLTIIYTQKDREVADQATEIINTIKASADCLDNGVDGAPILIASGGYVKAGKIR